MKSLCRFTIAAVLTAAALVAITGCKDKTAETPEAPAKGTPDVSAIAPIQASELGVPAQTDPNKVVVSVADEKLTQGELDKRIDAYMRSRGTAQMPPDRAAAARKDAQEMLVDGFIAETLLLKEADKQKIAVTDKDVDESVEELKTRLPPGMTFEIALQNQGMTMDDLRKRINNDVKTRKLMDTQLEAIADASDEDIKKFYDENQPQFEQPETVQARHILVRYGAEDDDAAKATKKADLEKVHKELTDGADFAAAAKEHSDCPSKAKGGDLGAFSKGRMVPEFEKAAFSQEIDAVGPIVETQFGYHIIQVTARNKAGVQPLEDIKDRIASFLNQKNKRDAAMKYVEELKSAAEITRAIN
jgi:peptidyl-prolyl cis-trans isomerase C